MQIDLVVDYGADDTGTTDIGPAFQAALDDLGTAGGGTLTIPGGAFRLDTGVVVQPPGNVHISAAPDTLVFRSAASSENVLLSNHHGNGGYGNPGNITVSGGTWDGGGSVNPLNVDMFYFSNCENIRYRDLTVLDIVDWHAIEFHAVRNGSATGCTFRGLRLENPDRHYTEAIQVQESPDGTPSDNLYVAGCTTGKSESFGGYGRFIGTHTIHPPKAHTNIKVVNNHIEWCSNYGVQARCWRHAVISGNTFFKCGGMVFAGNYPESHEVAWYWSDSQNVVISDNVGESIGTDPDPMYAAIRTQGHGNKTVEDVVIANNIVRNYGTEKGIDLYRTHEGVVSGNILKYSSGHAITVRDSHGVVVTGNNIRHAASGVTVTGTGDTVVDNNRYT